MCQVISNKAIDKKAAPLGNTTNFGAAKFCLVSDRLSTTYVASCSSHWNVVTPS